MVNYCHKNGRLARHLSPWARLIRKVYEADPLVCPKCNGLMRVIAHGFAAEGSPFRLSARTTSRKLARSSSATGIVTSILPTRR